MERPAPIRWAGLRQARCPCRRESGEEQRVIVLAAALLSTGGSPQSAPSTVASPKMTRSIPAAFAFERKVVWSGLAGNVEESMSMRLGAAVRRPPRVAARPRQRRPGRGQSEDAPGPPRTRPGSARRKEICPLQAPDSPSGRERGLRSGGRGPRFLQQGCSKRRRRELVDRLA